MNKCKCIICDREYETCNCESDALNKSWKIVCDTEEHYQLYMLISQYRIGSITKELAKTKLKRFDLSDYKQYNKGVVSLIDEILKDESKSLEVSSKSKTVKLKNKK